MKHRFAAVFLLAISLGTGPAAQASDDLAAQVMVGERLAAVLRVGRGVVSANQALINDPNVADKGLTGEVFRAKVVEAYLAKHGEAPVIDGLADNAKMLMNTQLAAMQAVIDDNQDLINAEGVAFKGFIPAIFARLVNERFADDMNTAATVKVTAPLDLVRNRKARPDAWEALVLEEKFRSADWVTGTAFYEDVEIGGKLTFRMLIPEYYSVSCLSCHGSPAGETDITGFPKEGGNEGELAGAISITLGR